MAAKESALLLAADAWCRSDSDHVVHDEGWRWGTGGVSACRCKFLVIEAGDGLSAEQGKGANESRMVRAWGGVDLLFCQ